MEEYNREQAAKTRLLMEEMEDVRMQQMRSDWENDLATKQRLSFMSEDAAGFKEKLKVNCSDCQIDLNIFVARATGALRKEEESIRC